MSPEQPRYYRAPGDPHGPVHVALARWPSIVRCGRFKAKLQPTEPDRHDCFCRLCVGIANHAAKGRRTA